MDPATLNRDEAVALLFEAAMSGNMERFAHDHKLEISALRQLRLRHMDDYVRYLEAVLYRIKDQIDY